MAQYTVLLAYDPETSIYTVKVPALPGCGTEGDSVEEALDMARDAIAGNLLARAEQGWEIPLEEPRYIVATIEVPIPVLAGTT
jgi:predicted RNase H-like HicB family nuclease